jgi:hypothetical protein
VPVPEWLIMPSGRAARLIVRAAERRRREVVITAHGKLAVWLVRHLPGLVLWGLRRPQVLRRAEQPAVDAPRDGS